MDELRSRRFRLLLAGLVGLTALLRVGLVSFVHNADSDRAITIDTPGYVEPATSIVEDGAYNLSADSSAPEFQRTPGYPAFLAALYWVGGDSDGVVVVIQAALSSLSVLFTVLVALRLSGSTAVALVAGFLLALDPGQAAQAGLIVTETLATVLLTMAAYFAVRFVQSGWIPRWGLAWGITLTAATYVRPTTYYFAVVVIGVLVVAAIRRREGVASLARPALIVVVPCVGLLGAWSVRNHYEVDSWRFAGIEATNLYWHRSASVVAARDGISKDEAQAELTDGLNRDEVPSFDYEQYENGSPPPAWQERQGEYYGRAQSAAYKIMRSEPLLTLNDYVRAVWGQFVQSGWSSALQYGTGHVPPGHVVAPTLLLVWGIEALAVIGAYLSLRPGAPHRFAHALTIALVVYIIVVSAAGPDASAGYRFRIPVWPFWCIYASLAIHRLAITRGHIRRPLGPAE